MCVYTCASSHAYLVMWLQIPESTPVVFGEAQIVKQHPSYPTSIHQPRTGHSRKEEGVGFGFREVGTRRVRSQQLADLNCTMWRLQAQAKVWG